MQNCLQTIAGHGFICGFEKENALKDRNFSFNCKYKGLIQVEK
jgi:hypothetical protein